MMVTIPCPKCCQSIDLESEQNIGQPVICTSCHTLLEVTWLFPVCLDYPEASEPNPILRDGKVSYLKSNNKTGDKPG